MKSGIKTLVLAVAFFIGISAFADEKAAYLELLQNNKMAELKTHLDGWAKKKPADPEMFIGYFNYYVNMARSERIVLGGKNPPKGDTALSISDPKTGETVGYLYGEVDYNPEYAEEALRVINRGLEVAPDRLDMHFGKTRLLAELRSYDQQRDYIMKLFEQGKKIRNRWLWSDGNKIDDPENFFVDAVHDYVAEWFNSDNRTAYESTKPVSELLVRYFPRNTKGYNDLGLYYARKDDLAKAEKQFLGAYGVDPSDLTVAGNLAYLYSVQNRTDEAIKFYTIIARSGNAEYAAYAKTQLEKLKK